MNNFDDAFEVLVGIEGGYVNDPADPGGETKYGISRRSYPHLDIANLTLEEAKGIYFRDFWTPLRADNLQPQLAFELFEQAVNFSVRRAVTHLQRSLNNFFDANLVEDGIMGLATFACARGATKRHLKALLVALNGEQYIHYRSLSPAQRRRYGVGWLANRVSLGESYA